MIALTRLSLRIQRFEFLAAVAIVVGVSTAAWIVQTHLRAAGVSPDCFAAWFASGGGSGGGLCAGLGAFFAIDNAEASPVMAAMAVTPYVAGLLLGVGLVGREIEAGTAAPAWALAGSRTYWLLGRGVPVLVGLVTLLALAAVASDMLIAAKEPWVPRGLSFSAVGGHGLVLMIEGVAAFTIAAAVGAVIGRVLPAVIVSAALLFALWIGTSLIRSEWLSNEAMRHERTTPADPITAPGGTGFASMSRAADGTLLTDQQAMELAPPGAEPAEWVAANFEPVYLFVPGNEYPRWALLEALEFGAAAVAGLGITLVVIQRRRPE